MTREKKPKNTDPKDYKSLQLWPGGKSLDVAGEGKRMLVRTHGWNGDPHGAWHKPTPEEYRAVRIEQLAEGYAERDIYFNDSSLVTDSMELSDSGLGDIGKEFSYENVKNLRPDPSDWTIEQCREWLDDKGNGHPDPDPWGMKRDELVAYLHPDWDGESETLAEYDDDRIRADVIREINDSDSDLEEWRSAVRDSAEDAEVYQWFRVSDWLAGELDTDGECVLDNAYGQWWGRQCCGQSLIMDGTLQKIAARQYDRYPDR
jgi:hypothetical protein